MRLMFLFGFILVIISLAGCTYSEDYKADKEIIKNMESGQVIREETSKSLGGDTLKEIPKVVEEKQEIKEEIKKEKPVCTNECSQSTCDGLYYISCIVGSDGCKDKQSKKKIIGECGIECLDNSDCSSDETCTLNKCLEKPEVLRSLEEAQDVLEEYQSKTDKLNECTKLCAGEEYDIPYVKNEWYSVCYQLYYYAGEEALDEQIADCKK